MRGVGWRREGGGGGHGLGMYGLSSRKNDVIYCLPLSVCVCVGGGVYLNWYTGALRCTEQNRFQNSTVIFFPVELIIQNRVCT